MNDIRVSQLPWEQIIRQLAVAHAKSKTNPDGEQVYQSIVNLFLGSQELRAQYLSRLAEIGKRDHRDKYYQNTGIANDKIQLLESGLLCSSFSPQSLLVTSGALLQVVASSLSWARLPENSKLLPYPEAYSLTELLLNELNCEPYSEQWTLEERLFLMILWFEFGFNIDEDGSSERSILFLSAILDLSKETVSSAYSAFNKIIEFKYDAQSKGRKASANLAVFKKATQDLLSLFVELSNRFPSSQRIKGLSSAIKRCEEQIRSIGSADHVRPAFRIEEALSGASDKLIAKDRLLIFNYAQNFTILQINNFSFDSGSDGLQKSILSIILASPLETIEGMIENINSRLFCFQKHSEEMAMFVNSRPQPSYIDAVLKLRDIEAQTQSLQKMLKFFKKLTASKLYGDREARTKFESILEYLQKLEALRYSYFDMWPTQDTYT